MKLEIPAFTKNIVCPGCNGTGFVKDPHSFSLKGCSWCLGSGKIPESNSDGTWMRKVI